MDLPYGVRITRTGLADGVQVPGGPAAYAQLLDAIHGHGDGMKWARGQLLILIEREYGDDAWADWCDGPRAPSRWTLQTERRTAEEFPPGSIRPTLSWTHHFRVLRISDPDEREELLDRAELMEWSVAELDAEITARKEEDDDTPPPDPHAMERTEYIVARASDRTGRRVTDEMVSWVLQAAHEWDEAREGREG